MVICYRVKENQYNIILVDTNLILFFPKASHLTPTTSKTLLARFHLSKLPKFHFEGKCREARTTRISHGTSFLNLIGEYLADRTLALHWHGALPWLTGVLAHHLLGTCVVIKHVEYKHATKTLAPDLSRR